MLERERERERFLNEDRELEREREREGDIFGYCVVFALMRVCVCMFVCFSLSEKSLSITANMYG